MAELMKESFYVAVFHKASSAVTTGEIADQSGYRQLNASDTILYRKSSSVVIFSFTRVHIHIEAPDDAIAIADLIGLYRLMPDFGMPRFYFHIEHCLS